MTGRRVGHYELGLQLGAGGMGVVYSARDIVLDRDVAIKLLPNEESADATSRSRLLREARAASALNHPNIVTVYEAGVDNDTQFIAMEIVSGENLAQTLARRQPTLSEVVGWALQIAEALECAHAATLTHRDLKPSNIMISTTGLVKVLDFGIARLNPAIEATTMRTSLTMPGAMIGTLEYMAPEQARGEDCTPRTDLFSFGVVLYEMIAGVRPFRGATPIEQFHELLYATPTPLTKLRAGTPPELAAIVDKTLRRKPEERFASMSEVVEQLRAVKRDLDVPPRWRFRYWKQALAGVALLGFVALAGVYWHQLSLPPWMRSRWVTKFSLPAGSAELVLQGRQYLLRADRTGALEAARASFEAAIQKDPSNAAAWAGMAETHLAQTGRQPDPALLKLAENSANKALELNPLLAVAHIAHASYLSQTGKHEQAIREARRAVELDPKNADAEGRLAVVLYLAQRGLPPEAAAQMAKEAEQHYRRSIALKPDGFETHFRFGTFLASKKRYTEAAAEVERARDLAPDNYQCHANLAVVYHMLGREEDSAAELQRSLESRPTQIGYLNLGTLYYYLGRYAESASAFEHAVSLNATSPVAWGNLGDATRWVPGRKQRSEEAYRRAIQLTRQAVAATPGSLILHARLANYLAKSGDRDGALRELSVFDKDKTQDHEALFQICLALELTGNRDRALTALASALKAGHPIKEARTDPELVALRADPRYYRVAEPYDEKR